MIHRIVVTGAESTGKTTLAQALAEYYDEPWTKEFVRDYVKQINRELQSEDLEPIVRGQLTAEDDGLEKAQRLIIHDTNASPKQTQGSRWQRIDAGRIVEMMGADAGHYARQHEQVVGVAPVKPRKRALVAVAYGYGTADEPELVASRLICEEVLHRTRSPILADAESFCVVGTEKGEVFGQDNELGALPMCLREVVRRVPKVCLDRAATRHLDGRGFHRE